MTWDRRGSSLDRIELRDEQIVLRPWREDDAPWVYEACQDPAIQRWLPDLPRPYTHDDAHAFVTDAIGLGPYQFAITVQGQLAGSIGLRSGKHETGHIGYWCAPGARCQGTTTRALRRLCRYGID